MNERSFLDTNILVYTDDADSPKKRSKSLEIVTECRRRRLGVVSTQVLQEYFVTVTRKLGVKAEVARRKTELFARLQLVPVRVEDILGAIDLHRLHSISFWDALIVRAAMQAQCQIIYSEDLHHGWEIDGLKVVNPFA